MRSLLAALVGFAAHSTATAQTATGSNEGSRLTHDRTLGSYDFSWWGKAGRTYFIQQSDRLATWEYLPLIESGADGVLAWSFTSTADRFFLRLRYSDIPTSDPFTADFDGDQVSNYDELWMGTDPLLSVDSDSDGLPDDWEVAHGLNPNDAADAASDGDGDGLTNHGEFTAGTDPANPDTDGDGFSDSSETATGSSPLDSSSYVIRFRHISRGANAFDYVQQQFTEEDLGRPVQDGDHGWIEDNRSWLPLQEPIRTYLLDAFSVSALRPSIAFPPAPPADAWTWNPQLSPSSPGAGCAAPVWSNDDIGTVQERRYWLVRDYPSAVPISYTVLEVSRRVKNDNPPVIEVNPITFVIPANESRSASVDLEEHLTIATGRPHRAVQETEFAYSSLLSVDIDVIHPASGELSDAKEDTGDGGYVSVRRMVDDEDVTPITKLVVRAVGGAQSSWKTRLKFTPGDRYKIYSDEERTQEVTSEQTEFDATQETTLYFEGLKKSASRGGEEIKMQVKVGSSPWSDGDSLKCTVVQSEFLFQVKAFIPYAWTEAEDLWPGTPNPMAGKVAKGDQRTFLNVYSDDKPRDLGGHFEDASFRVCQTVIVTPYKELHDAPDIQSKRKLMTAPLSEHRVKTASVDPTEMSLHYGYIALGGTNSAADKPPKSREHYDLVKRTGRVAEVTVEGAGKDGALGIYTAVADDIHWRLYLKVWAENEPLHPTVEFGGKHDRYPAYEIIVIQSDGTYKDIHRVPPNSGDRPGPGSLDDGNARNVGRSDTVE